MGKPVFYATLIVSAFCFSSVFGLTQNEEHFFVEGKIYCDPCRLEFETRLSHPLSGIKVSLECRRPDNGSLAYSIEGNTDKNGIYSLAVKGDHEDEICQLKTVKSTHSDCSEIMANWSDRIVLTKNMGVSSLDRYVNPLGFKTQGVNPECANVIKEWVWINLMTE